MQAGAHAAGRPRPRLQALRVGQGLLTAPENLGFDLGMDLAGAGQFLFVLVEPVGKAKALLAIEFQHRLCQFFHAHGQKSTVFLSICEQKESMGEIRRSA